MRLSIHANGKPDNPDSAVIVLNEGEGDGGGVVGGIADAGKGVFKATINDPAKITGVDGLTGSSVADVKSKIDAEIAAGNVIVKG